MFNFIYSLITSFCLTTSFSIFKSIKGLSFKQFYETNTIIVTLLAICIFMICKKVKDNNLHPLKKAFSYLLAIFVIIGECYISSKTITIMWKNIFEIVLSIGKLLTYGKLFQVLLIYLETYIDKIKLKDKITIKNKYLNKYLKCFEEKPFRTTLITLFIGYSIFMIAFYPIILSPDPSFQIIQFFNVPNKYADWVILRDPSVFMTTHHPVLQTWMLGYSILFGRFLGSDNFGLFIYTIVQTLLLTSTLAYSIKVLKDNKVGNKICLFLVGMYLLTPMYAIYSVSAVKDTIYTCFLMLFTLFIFDFIKNFKDTKISNKKVINLFLIMLFICLFRNNGIYIIGLTLPFIFFYSKKNMSRVAISFVTMFVCLFSFNNILVPSLGISSGSIREMLSIPFQQTARYVIEYEDEMDKEDLEIIDNILGLENMKKKYNPELADPVKNNFNKNTTNEELKDYFGVWFKGLFKHPITYVDATLNNIYGFFTPSKHKWYFHQKLDKSITESKLIDYHYNKLGFLRLGLNWYGQIFPYIPIIGLFENLGFNTWVLIGVCVYLLVSKKNKKHLITMLPCLGTLVFCILGPANTYFRYSMPYMFILPSLIILLLNEKKF